MPIKIALLSCQSNKKTIGYNSQVYFGKSDDSGYLIVKLITVFNEKLRMAAEREIHANLTCNGSLIGYSFEDKPTKKALRVPEKSAANPAQQPVHREYTLVLKYIPGMDLESVFKQNPDMTPDHRLALFYLMAGALLTFHQNYMVHRDVKPDNFLLRKDGSIEAFDFTLSIKTKLIEDMNNNAQLKRMNNMTGAPVFTAEEAGSLCTQYSDIASLAYTFLWLLDMIEAYPYGRITSEFDFKNNVPESLKKKWHFTIPQANGLSHILEAMLNKTPEMRMPLDVVVSELSKLYDKEPNMSAWAKAHLEGKEFIPHEVSNEHTVINFTPRPIKDLIHTGYDYLRVGQQIRNPSPASKSAPAVIIHNLTERIKGIFVKKNPPATPESMSKKSNSFLLNTSENSQGSPDSSLLFQLKTSSSGGSPTSSFLRDINNNSHSSSIDESESCGFIASLEELKKILSKQDAPALQRGSYDLIQEWQTVVKRFVCLIEDLFLQTQAINDLNVPHVSLRVRPEKQTKKDFIHYQLQKILQQFSNYLTKFNSQEVCCSHFAGNSEIYLECIQEELSTLYPEAKQNAEPLQLLLTQLRNCIKQLGTSNPDSIHTHSPDLSGFSGNASRRGSLTEPLPILNASLQQKLTNLCNQILDPGSGDASNSHQSKPQLNLSPNKAFIDPTSTKDKAPEELQKNLNSFLYFNKLKENQKSVIDSLNTPDDLVKKN